MPPSFVIGVGNRLKGDDAIGCLVADGLAGAPGIRVVDAGTAPENYLEPVASAGPDRVLFVDACAFGGKPGDFRLFPRADIDRLAAQLVSTHTLPLSMTVAMLERLTGARIELLGVQPESLGFDAELSPPLRAALPRIVAFVRGWVAGGATARSA